MDDVKRLLPGKPLLLGEFGRSSVPIYPNQIFGWMSRPEYFRQVGAYIIREHSANIQGTFREHSVTIQ